MNIDLCIKIPFQKEISSSFIDAQIIVDKNENLNQGSKIVHADISGINSPKKKQKLDTGSTINIIKTISPITHNNSFVTQEVQ